MKTQLAFLAGMILLVLAGAAYAHHPFAVEYDWTKPVTLTGTVSKIEWANPHVTMEVDAKDESGQMKHWILEMGSPGALTKAGWTRNTLKKGDMVTVEGWLGKSDRSRANVKSVKLPDGKELSGASSIGDMKTTPKPVSN